MKIYLFLLLSISSFRNQKVSGNEPASMLPLTKILKEKVNTLPHGAVFLCYSEENPRQRKLLEQVGETFREQGHVVRSMSMGEVYKTTPKF
jgi:hypothetical protein